MTPNSVTPLYFTINKVNGYIDENNWNKFLTLVYTDKGKDALKSMENYGRKTKILLIQQVISQINIMKNI